MSSLQAVWSRALLIVLGLLCVVAAALVVFSIVLIVSDERTHSDDWDGLGTLIGLIAGGLALMFIAVLLALFALTRFARRKDSRRHLTVAAGISLVVALVFIAGVASIAGNTTSTAFAVYCLPGLVLAVPALGTLLAGRAVRDPSGTRPPA